MKLYAVQNENGNYWSWLDEDWSSYFNRYCINSDESANFVAFKHGGRVVTFVEAPEPVYLVKINGKFERPTYYALKNGKLGFGYKDPDRRDGRDFKPHKFTLDEIKQYDLMESDYEEVEE